MKSGILKNLRNNYGISQKDFAFALGVSQQTVASWEVGRTEPSNDLLKAIADYFNVSTDYLLGRSEPNRKNALSDEQTTLLKNYDLLGTDGRNLLQALLNSLLMSHSKKYNAPNNNHYATAM